MKDNTNKDLSALTGPGTAATPLPTNPPLPVETERAELATKAMLTQNSLALEAQLEERPLAKKQEALQVASSGLETATPPAQQKAEQKLAEIKLPEAEEATHPKHVAQKPLLKNDDFELERIGKVRLCDYAHEVGPEILLSVYLFSYWTKSTSAFSAPMRLVHQKARSGNYPSENYRKCPTT